MTMESSVNWIDSSARISRNVHIGQFNRIGPNVVIDGFEGATDTVGSIGDCNVIEEGTRILVGPGRISIGDYNTIHRDTTILGTGGFIMGHNGWMGQGCYIDCRGGVILKNGVRLGTQTHIWSHAASGELVEGCTLNYESQTILEDNVWVVGDHVSIMPGRRLGRNSIILPHSVVLDDTTPNIMYGGIPAKIINRSAWRTVDIEEKMKMMERWANEFQAKQEFEVIVSSCGNKHFNITGLGDELWVCKHIPEVPVDFVTYFDITTKKYTKRLSKLEMRFILFLLGNKARFVPV